MRRRGRSAAAGLAALALVLAAGGAAASPTGGEALTYAGETVVVERDAYGVAHVWAPSAEAGAYALGYLQAEDKLWLASLLRTAAHGRLSEWLGPLDSNVASDRAIRLLGYTPAERARKFARLPGDVQAELTAHAEGMSAYIAEANADPAKIPGEFVHLAGGLPIPAWTIDDSMALWDIVVASSSDGGRADLNQSLLRQRLIAAHGPDAGAAMFDDLVRAEDPDAPVTVPRDLDWRRDPTLADPAVEARRSLAPDARLSLPEGATSRPATGVRVRPPDLLPPGAQAAADLHTGIDAALERIPIRRFFGSNAQVVAPHLSRTGNTLLTAGPQTDYTAPHVYWEFGLHVAGDFEVSGVTVPGLPFPAFARGPGYTWTVTNGYSDYNDTYVEQLNPDNPREYLFQGRWEPMDCRTESHTFKGVEFSSQEICRTRHGPVLSFDTAAGVAYSRRPANWDREDGTIVAFQRWGRARDIGEFATAVAQLTANWNVFYADDDGTIGYWHAGLHPRRAAHDDIRLLHDGTGGSEWEGLLPVDEVPHATTVERGWLVNWNNTPAADWPRTRADGVRHRVLRIADAFDDGTVADPWGGPVNPDGRWTAADAVANLRRAAHTEQGDAFRDLLPSPSELTTERAREALAIARTWDGLAYDADDDGYYDSPAVPLLRRWLDVATAAVFADDLGADAGWARVDDLWHVLSSESTAPLRFDWLGGADPRQVAAETFEAAVAAMSGEPQSWRRAVSMTRYTHYNLNLAGDLVDAAECPDPIGGTCLRDHRDALGVAPPGYVAPHMAMNRGGYNHVVAYQEPPSAGSPRGAVPVVACSVLTPGNSGFQNLAGQVSPHFADQRELYVTWQLKHMALTDAQIDAAQQGAPCS